MGRSGRWHRYRDGQGPPATARDVRVETFRSPRKPPKEKETEASTDDEVTLFLDSVGDHRFAVALRLGVLHGLGRSEALALRWDDVDTAYGTLRIDEGLIAVRKGAVWSDAKNARSRRVIALDDGTMRAIARRRRQQE